VSYVALTILAVLLATGVAMIAANLRERGRVKWRIIAAERRSRYESAVGRRQRFHGMQPDSEI
jgi:hypothetical protein